METFNNITAINNCVINDTIANKNYEPISVFCATCPFNDGLVYASNPPQYKCTKTGEWHMGNYGCGKVFEKREYIYMGEDKQ